MAWLVLVGSGLLEAVWATALGRSEGLSLPGPTAVFVIALALSMAGLGWAATRIAIGTAYAVWVGIGAALTVCFAIATGEEPFSVWKAVFIVGIIGAVIGLKLVPDAGKPRPAPAADPGRR